MVLFLGYNAPKFADNVCSRFNLPPGTFGTPVFGFLGALLWSTVFLLRPVPFYFPLPRVPVLFQQSVRVVVVIGVRCNQRKKPCMSVFVSN